MRKRCSRRKFSALALLFTLVLLSGCSNNPYPAGEPKTRTIYTYFVDDPKTFDPSVAYTVDESEVIDNIYPGYYKYDYLKRLPFKLDLLLGATEPIREPYVFSTTVQGKTVQKTGEKWVFNIKHGLYFQDDPCFPGGKGREILASDFLYSFRRMADPNVPCPILSFFSDKVIGLQEYIDYNQTRNNKKLPTDYTYPIAGLQLSSADPYQFTILLNQPYPQLRYLMELHFTSPLPHEAIDYYQDKFAFHPVGSGMFELAEYTRKQRIVLKVNPNHYQDFYPTEGMPGDREAGLLKDAGKPLPLCDNVVFTYIPESITQWNQFQQGYLDIYGVTQQNFNQVINNTGALTPDMQQRGISLSKEFAVNVWYLAFNMKDPVVGGYTPQKRKLRQAISLAIDSPEYINLFYNGMGEASQFIIPPGLFGYDATFRNPYRQYNIEKARELLKEAGYPDGKDPSTGVPLTIYDDNSATDSATKQEVLWRIKQLSKIGVNLVSRTSTWAVLQTKEDKGQFQTVALGWYADYPDPENFLFLLYGPNMRPGPNVAGYDNPEYDKIFEQMRQMDDGPARKALIEKLRTIAVEDCPWVYLFNAASPNIHYDWYLNYKKSPIAYDVFAYQNIDTEKRVSKQAEWNKPIYWPVLAFILVIVVGSIPAANVVVKRRRRHIRKS
jgi:oligopeptide transport system substrate-binding protein